MDSWWDEDVWPRLLRRAPYLYDPDPEPVPEIWRDGAFLDEDEQQIASPNELQERRY